MGSRVAVNSLIRIGTSNSWASVSAGYSFTIALKTDGTLWSWGDNAAGSLGQGNFSDRSTPTQIGTGTWAVANAGSYHVVAIKSDGTLWAWGRNTQQQLGDGTAVVRNTPTQIGTETDWLNTMPANTHSLALKTDYSLWGWGSNFNGEIGDATNINRSVPVPVTCSQLTTAVFNAAPLHIYPNPTSDILFIKTASGVEAEKVEVFNLLGQLIKSDYRTSFVSVSGFPAGTYIISTLINGIKLQSKFMIQ